MTQSTEAIQSTLLISRDPDDLFNLGKHEYDCDNMAEALWYFTASVWEGHKQGRHSGIAARFAGKILYETEELIDTKKAYLYLNYAANEGDSAALCYLGAYHLGCDLMEKGCGFRRVPTVGIRYMNAAAVKDQVYAMIELCHAYLEGKGVPCSKSVAAEWAVKAATRGSLLGMLNAGEIYESLEDYAKAGYWFNECVEHSRDIKQDDGNYHNLAQNALRRYKYSSFFDKWSLI